MLVIQAFGTRKIFMMHSAENRGLERLARRVPPEKAVKAKIYKLVAHFSARVGDGQRSIPGQVGSTVPDHPIAPAKPQELPQPMTGTSDEAWPMAEPVYDPTLQK